MAVVIGKLSMIGDLSSSKTILKNRIQSWESVVSLQKRERDCGRMMSAGYGSATRSLESSEGQGRSDRFTARGKSSEEGDLGGGEEWWNESGGEEVLNWENGMRMKEMEDMRQLERKAEELQSMMEEDGGVWAEETEEERKLRVRKELEKV